jgi:FkbM family methyltransferase
MGLSIEDRLKHFLPAQLYYPYKTAKERRRGEPELAILSELVPPGSTAVDVGANRGFYSYALAKLAGRVEAFEPHPALARFARRKLGRSVSVHELALADQEGRATLYVPQTTLGIDSHRVSNLGNVYPTLFNVEIEVRVATLDSFGFERVGFVKIDAEGSEMAVLDGAAQTISRCRPNLVVELLVDWHENWRGEIERIERGFDYASFVVIDGARVEALPALHARRAAVKSNNVLFMPK